MADLRALCTAAGFADPCTYIQSGNVVFVASGKAAALERELEQALAQRFGFEVDVVVRGAKQWQTLLRSNPFLDAAQKAPNHLLVGLSKRPLRSDVVESLQPKTSVGEQVAAAGGALWIHCAHGIADSKLTAPSIDRAAGSAVTARNWRTVLALASMADVTA